MTVKNPNKKTTIRIPITVKDEVKAIAEKENRSCEGQAALLLKQGVEKYKAAEAAR